MPEGPQEKYVNPRAAAAQAALGRALTGKYILEDQIGKGGMARVFRARDLRHDRPVAIKVLHPELASDISTDRFSREIRIVSNLTHPNIVGLIDSGFATSADGEQLPYFVMHYIEGESLRQKMRREGPMAVDEAVQIACEVADALDFAHEHGVIHRDIKPENILIQAGHAMVADFGVALVLRAGASDETGAGRAVGTPHYMSPEQWDGESTLDGRTDLYSLGCVLYEMLVGAPPFTGPSAQTVASRHRMDPMPPIRTVRPTVPVPVEAALERALAKQPGDRFLTADAFRTALQSALQPSRPTRFARGILVGGVTIAMAWLAWFVLTPGPPERDLLAVAVLSDLEGLDQPQSDLTRDVADRVMASLTSVATMRVFDSLSPPVGTAVKLAVAGPRESPTVTVKVLDAATRELMKSQTWDPGRADAEMQLAVAAQVTAFVRRTIGQARELRAAVSTLGNADARAAVLQAEDHFQKGREAYHAGDAEQAAWEFAQADRRLAEAHAFDPSSPLPWVKRGWVSYDMSFFVQDSAVAAEAAIQRGIAYADSALVRDPTSAPALALRGSLGELLAFLVPSVADSVLPDAERDLKAALARDNRLSGAWVHLSRIYRRRNRLDEAKDAVQAAQSFDDFLQDGHDVAGQLLVLFREVGQRDKVETLCEQGRWLYGEYPDFRECRLVTLGYFGSGTDDVRAAWRELRAIERSNGRVEEVTAGYRRAMVAAVLARSGQGDSALVVLRRSRRAGHLGVDIYEAYIRAILGDTRGVLGILSPMIERDTSFRASFRTSSWFRTLHDNREFRRLVGLPAEN